MNEKGMIELKDFFHILKNKAFLVFGITLLITIVSCLVIVLIIPPVYEAEVSIIIGNPKSSGSEKSSYDYNEIEMYQKLVSTYIQIAKSRKVAEGAAKIVGRGMDTQTIQNSVTITSQEDTQIISIKARSASAKEAAGIVNAVANSFIEQSKDIFNLGNIQILDSAKAPQSPIQPKKGMDIFISFIIGLIVSSIVIFIRDYMNKTFKSERDAEESLNLDVLSVISETSLKDLKPAASEEYRILKANIEFSFSDNEGKIIAVTSAEEGDGRTKTCADLGIVTAEQETKTLLVDFDLRNPKLHEMFNIPNTFGLSDMMEGYEQDDSIIVKTNVENLYILTSGTQLTNPWKVYKNIDMQEIISSLKESYGFIIIDTPPVNSFADAQILSQYADGCIMVISCDKTNKEAAAKAKYLLEKARANILGIVFNKRDIKFSDYLRNGVHR